MTKQTAAGSAAPGKAPDNNKRLAELEEQSAKLGRYFAEPIEGLEDIDGESPTDRALRAFNHVETARSTLAGDADKLGRALRSRSGFVEKDGESAAAAAIRTMREQDKEVQRLSGSLRAYKGSATKARAAATVLPGNKSPQARPIGALAPARDDVEQAGRSAALADALQAGPVSIVFSDGRREIRELPPLIVSGDSAWRRTAREFILQAGGIEPVLEPGEMGKPTVSVAGFGLLDESGRQVGWHELVEPIVVPRNGRVQLPANTIRFAF